MIEGKSIFITGGAGFIGSHVVDLFEKNNFKVVVIDNLSSGSEENLSRNTIFYNADITDKKKIDTIFSEEKPTVVSHHAAQINVRASLENPQNDAHINIIGGLNVLECARKYNTQKIIFFLTTTSTFYNSFRIMLENL